MEFELCKSASRVPAGGGWLYELKYDGYRIMAYCFSGRAELMTRGGADYTKKFAEAARAVELLARGRNAVLDGEIIALDYGGRPDFQALQGYMKNPRGKTLVYKVFDLLYLDGDLRGLPLFERKRRLSVLLSDKEGVLSYSKHVCANGDALFVAAEQNGLEGIVAKRADSTYKGGRGGDWVKVKCQRRGCFAVCGYVVREGRTDISALLLGAGAENGTEYCGRVGSGISRGNAERLKSLFEPLITSASPLTNAPKPQSGERIVWLKPQLYADVQFAERTNGGVLRHASYKGISKDKRSEK